MDYGQLLTDAWQIVWKNKFLFILGFLAALGATGGSGGNNLSYTFNPEDLPPGFESSFELFLDQYAANGEKVSLGDALGAGFSKLGRMIGIYLILYSPFILLGILLVVLALVLAGAAIGYELSNAAATFEPILASVSIIIACLSLLCCVLLPLLAAATIILPFAQRAAVLEDYGVTASIGRAWRVIKANLGEVAILVLLFLAISIGYGFAVAMIMVPLAFLAAVPAFISLVIDGTFGAGNFFALLCGSLAIGLLAALLNALWTTYRSATMTLAYRRLVEKAPK
jgi:hypothetical protein